MCSLILRERKKKFNISSVNEGRILQGCVNLFNGSRIFLVLSREVFPLSPLSRSSLSNTKWSMTPIQCTSFFLFWRWKFLTCDLEGTVLAKDDDLLTCMNAF